MPTTDNYDSMLTALALIDAYAARDEDSITALLDEGQNAGPVVSHLLEVLTRVLRVLAVVTDRDPMMPIDVLRSSVLERIAGAEGPRC